MRKVLLLQQYENNMYGYKGIDNIDNNKKVISEQDILERREDYINKYNLTFTKHQYGSNLNLDMQANGDVWVRRKVAERGYGLDKLVNDEDSFVRVAVARQGYALEKLVYDIDEDVRIAVANQGYGLDKLIDDENSYVRAAVAKQGYRLDKLVNDNDGDVRRAVAENGYGLEKLINDNYVFVREAVAKQGYGLDKLIDDPESCVRQAVATQGYGLEILIKDEDKEVRFKALDAIIKFNRDDIIIEGSLYIDCYDFINYLIIKDNPKMVATILMNQINNSYLRTYRVFNIVRDYAEKKNISALFDILDIYREDLKGC